MCHPLGQIVKQTGPTPKTLRVDDRDIVIPANTIIEINLAALHTHPKYWGSDCLVWNPKRFIVDGSSIENETLLPDTRVGFIPWAQGRHICPGKKFSQVELAAVLAILFRDNVVEVVPEKGETAVQARERVGKIAAATEMRLLNEMSHPEKAGVRWVRRK